MPPAPSAHPDEAALLASLPGACAKELRAAIASPDETSGYRHVAAALESVAFPRVGKPRRVFPLASSLTPPQRAVAEVLAHHAARVEPFALPATPDNRRHWLGLSSKNELDHAVTVKYEGAEITTPLWRAMQIAGSKVLGRVPVGIAARAFALVWQDLSPPWYTHFFDQRDVGWDAFDQVHPRLGAECAPWIAAYADHALEVARTRAIPIARPVRWICSVGIVRARIPFEARWAPLFPIEGRDRLKLTVECLDAVPEERRSETILAGLAAPAGDVYDVPVALKLLKSAPSRELAAWITDHADGADGLTKREVLAAVAAATSKLGSVAKSSRTALTLRYEKTASPTDVADMAPTERRQLQIAGKDYDGQDLPAKARLAAGAGDEASFRGTLEVGRLVDEAGKALFDVLLYAGDSGSIFRAGTTTRAASIVQDGVDCGDEALGEAIEQALADRARSTKRGSKASKPKPAKRATAKATKRAKRG